MATFALARSDQNELMDSGLLGPSDLRAALDFLALTNRRFGGAAVILRFLASATESWPHDREVTVLDVGTGLGDIPTAIASWARESGLRVRITGIDSDPHTASCAAVHCAAFPNISIERAELADLRATQRTFDFVIASLFLHHMPVGDEASALLTLDALAARGMVVSDLQRSWLSFAAVWAASAIFGNWVVRHDGPLSVRRAFTVPELDQLRRHPQLQYLSAKGEPWFRLSLSGVKP